MSLVGEVREDANAEEADCQNQSVGLVLHSLSRARGVTLDRRGMPDVSERIVGP